MKEITCSVINDLLPLYIDKMLSNDSNEIVEEHLENCKFCRAEMQEMKKPIVIGKNTNSDNIKKLKKSVSIRSFVVVTLLCLAITAVLFTVAFKWGYYNSIHSQSGGASGELINYLVLSLIGILGLGVLSGWLIYLVYYIKYIRGKGKPSMSMINRIIITVCATLLGIYLAALAGFFLLFYGTAAQSDNIATRSEIQYSPLSYLNQEWVLHFQNTKGNAINLFREETYNDEGVVTGITYYVHEVPINLMLESGTFTIGYSTGADNDETNKGLSEVCENFTVTIVYRDKTVIYSMRDEGLFQKQKNVKYAPETDDVPETNDTAEYLSE